MIYNIGVLHLVIDTRKQFQLQTGVFLKRPDVVTFDVCIVFELGDKMLTLSSIENLIVQCNLPY